MIYVDRSSVPRPEWFGSPYWYKRTLEFLKEVYPIREQRSQRRVSSVLPKLPLNVEDAVWNLFEGRCAMCEQAIAGWDKGETVERFRPVEVAESRQRHHYTFAATLWENLILLCLDCQRVRGNRFPVQLGGTYQPPRLRLESMERYPPSALYDELLRYLKGANETDKPMVIDPTLENPAEWMVYLQDGRMGTSKLDSGKAVSKVSSSINLFHLNGLKLVQERADKVRQFQAYWKAVGKYLSAVDVAAEDFGDSFRGSFQLAKAYGFARVFRGVPEAGRILAKVRGISSGWEAYHKNILEPVLRQVAAEERYHGADGSLTDGEDALRSEDGNTVSRERPFSTERITKVEIRDFRQCRNVVLEFPLRRPPEGLDEEDDLRGMVRAVRRSLESGRESEAGGMSLDDPSAYCGWKMLLGDNGAGKSSILQAIAIALLIRENGPEAIPATIEARRNLAYGLTEGSIRLWTDNSLHPIEVRFSESGFTLAGERGGTTPPESPLYLRCYGATRLVPPPRTGDVILAPATPDVPAQSLGSLFDPYQPLMDPVPWLLALGKTDTDALQQAFITLKDLLDLPAGVDLRMDDYHGKSTIGLDKGGRFTPLEHFSAGYQSIVVLACDIMGGLMTPGGVDMRLRTGVVLLDEIGTNLHPRWRLRIVEALRRTFPQLQFIVSTHEPLCLRGMGKGEVAVLTMDRHEHDVRVRDDLPSPATYRVDQLLTGDFFGLQTAYDPDEEEAFDLYHSLLVDRRSGRELNPEQLKLLARLEMLLKDRSSLGGTVSERWVTFALELGENTKGEIRSEPIKGSLKAEAAARKLLAALPGTPRTLPER